MTIRLFIGTSANGEDAEAEMVYEYSLRKNCSEPIEITWMRQTNDKDDVFGGWDTRYWPTPFSGYRWAIPEMCNFKGKAIYTDVDMINFRDISELWNTDFKGHLVAARRGKRFGGHEFCVMLMDCKQLQDAIAPIRRMKLQPEFHQRYINMFSGNEDAVKELDPRWNCLDGEDRDASDIWQLHYSRMSTQPWRPTWFTGVAEDHPRPELVELWFKHRDELLASGATPTVVNNNVTYDFIGK
jgi:hypothetical protein